MRRYLLALALAQAFYIGAPAYAHQAGCSVDFDALLALDEAAFDQSPPDGGWRRLDRPGCHAAAADLIAAWRARHPQASPTVAWHQGQMLAQAGRHDEAVPVLAGARKPADADLAGWNPYVDATVAFLSDDREALVHAREALAAQPYPDVPDMPPLVDGHMELPTQPGQPPMRMRWPPNLDVVDGLLYCFGRSYGEAYGPACRGGGADASCALHAGAVVVAGCLGAGRHRNPGFFPCGAP